MTRKRLANIIGKEWTVIFADLSNALFVTLLPLLIIAQLLFYIWLADNFGQQAILENQIFQTALDRLAMVFPAVAGLPVPDQLKVLLLSQFNFFGLLIPTMIAMSFAAFSIVEEKTSRSLEPLLATPVRTWELLLGKAFAGAIPALIVTWICGVIFILAVYLLGWGYLVRLIINANWFITLFLLTPAVTVLSFLLGIIGSSRARDAKSAQNVALFIVFPVIGLIGVQIGGVVWFTPLLMVILSLAIFGIDWLVLRAAVKLFQRESIITRWR